jgi:protein-S-isoprenylcysteine O-methyltransferase Ste14
MATIINTETRKPGLNRWGIGRLVQVLVGTIGMGVVLFVTAGRWDWVAAWVLMAEYSLTVMTFGLWVARKNPDLINERGRIAANVKGWDKILMSLYTLMLVVLFVVAGLDAGRFGWSTMPLAVQALGFLAIFAAMVLTYWVMLSNPFLSSFVRIQDDRGHQVASTGPYRYVRHPMYVGVILLFGVGTPLLLGSWWALAPGAATTFIFIVRTALEDRTLRAELPGYAEYAQRVRYRLLPGVW